MFELTKQSRIYYNMDCKYLMDGYEAFRSWMVEHTGLYVEHYITIQSLASEFMLKGGCCDNVFQTSGVLQQYITRSVVGGRCMTANNKMYQVKQQITSLMPVVYIPQPCIS